MNKCIATDNYLAISGLSAATGLSPGLLHAMRELWKEPGVRESAKHSNEYEMNDFNMYVEVVARPRHC